MCRYGFAKEQHTAEEEPMISGDDRCLELFKDAGTVLFVVLALPTLSFAL